jgi:hypothetical protein
MVKVKRAQSVCGIAEEVEALLHKSARPWYDIKTGDSYEKCSYGQIRAIMEVSAN